MRVTLSLSQLKKILRTERIKFPISFKSEDFTDQELKEFLKLMQQAEERG
jgi:hypothetical protein